MVALLVLWMGSIGVILSFIWQLNKLHQRSVQNDLTESVGLIMRLYDFLCLVLMIGLMLLGFLVAEQVNLDGMTLKALILIPVLLVTSTLFLWGVIWHLDRSGTHA